MSKSLVLECDPIDQPAAADSIERRTWCALRIRVGGRTVTRIWDKGLQEERSLLYVPAFPIAEWIVQNWWTLLNEPCRSEAVPGPAAGNLQFPWIKRHCLRSAESGLLLPALYLFNDGRGVRAEWQAEERDALPNMLGEFIDSGVEQLDTEATKDALARFVSDLLSRVKGIEDERVDELSANWQAIQGADVEEVKFCIAAGRMGVDPYDPSEMTDLLAAFLEGPLGEPDLPVARDLTEVAEARSAPEQWSWVQNSSATLKLGPITKTLPIQSDIPAQLLPARAGYQLARRARELAGLGPLQPVSSVQESGQTLAGASFEVDDRNHIPGHGIRAIVGWTKQGDVCLAGPLSHRSDSHRFLIARGLYHALLACDQSERLVTDAYTWDRQISRAFAAEFLAPQAALIERTGGYADSSKVEELASDYQVSGIVIEKQLKNAGVTRVDD